MIFRCGRSDAVRVVVAAQGSGNPSAAGESRAFENVRTRTQGGTVALSGFTQGVAYALGPLLVGLLHDVSGGWTVPLLFLLAVALVTIIPAITLARPAFVEDELARLAPTTPERAGRT